MRMHLNHPVYHDLLKSDPHYASLLRRKEELDEALKDEMARTAVDWDGVTLIKKKKLGLSDELDNYLRKKNLVH